MSRIVHLVQRFVFSLRPGTPAAEDETWLFGHLNESERALYEAQAVADRVHSIRCARHVAEARGDSAATSAIIVASALHDVGKAEAPLPVVGRVAATVLDAATRGRIRRWRQAAGWRGAMGRYVDHDERGAALLEAAGSADIAVAWARGHHQPLSAWPLDPDDFAVLHEADHA